MVKTADTGPVAAADAVIPPDLIASGPSFDQQAAAHAAGVNQTRLPDMMLTGGIAGLGLGALAGLLSGRRRRNPSLYGQLDAGPVELPKVAAPLFDPGQAAADPTYGLQLVGGLGLPLLGGFALAKGIGGWRKRQRERDEANAVKQEYQQALQGYVDGGVKAASEPTALDRLAAESVKKADYFDDVNYQYPAHSPVFGSLDRPGVFERGGFLGSGGQMDQAVHDPVAVGRAVRIGGGVGLLGGLIFATRRKMLEHKKQMTELNQHYEKVRQLTSPTDQAGPVPVKAATGPGPENGFGLFGTGDAVGAAVNTGANLLLPAAALYGGYHLYKGFRNAQDEKRKRYEAVTDAVKNYRRKQLYMSPPPITAVEPAAA